MSIEAGGVLICNDEELTELTFRLTLGDAKRFGSAELVAFRILVASRRR